MQLPLHVSPVSASFLGLQRLGILLVLSFACLCCSWLVLRSGLAATGGMPPVTDRQAASVSLLLVKFSSALGKIEVIIRYSVVNVLIAERHGIMPYFANVVN